MESSYLMFFMVLFCVLMIAAVVIWYLYHKVKAMPDGDAKVAMEDFEPFFKVAAGVIVKLTNANFIEQLELLIRESNVESKLPAFYEKYLELNKTNKEGYFQNLLEMLGKNRGNYINTLLGNHPEISTQEILLLILMQEKFDNKSIARILFITPETLKKRKSRLKAKLGRKEDV